MGQCELCGRREGVREAGVYIDGKKQAVPVCAPCVYEAMRKNHYSFGFGLGLQLCWFVVAGQGFFTLPGAFAAVMAIYGLARLVLVLAAFVALRAGGEKPVPEWVWKYAMAQAVTEDVVRDEYAERICNVKVQTPREYERTHAVK